MKTRKGLAALQQKGKKKRRKKKKKKKVNQTRDRRQ
jgi:hypothetical protein